MPGYDPQRARQRPRPTNGSSAPVDAILDPHHEDPATEATTPGRAGSDEEAGSGEEPTAAEPVPVPDAEPVEVDDAQSEALADEPTAVDLRALPEPTSPARKALVGVALLAALVAVLWWWRARGGDDEG